MPHLDQLPSFDSLENDDLFEEIIAGLCDIGNLATEVERPEGPSIDSQALGDLAVYSVKTTGCSCVSHSCTGPKDE